MKLTPVQDTKALEHFAKLDDTDKVLLELLSFHYLPATQESLLSTFNSYAKAAGLRRLEGFGPLNRLEKAGLLTREASLLSCRSEIVEDVSTHAARGGRAKGMCSFLHRIPAGRSSHLDYQSHRFASARRSLYMGDTQTFLRERNYSSSFFRYAFGQGPHESDVSGDYFQRLVRGMASTAPLDFYSKDFSFQLVHAVLLQGLQNGENFDICSLWLEQFAKREEMQGIYPILFEKDLAQGNMAKVDETLKNTPVAELLWCRSIALGQEPDPTLDPSYQKAILHLPLLGFLLSLACLKKEDFLGFQACVSHADEGYDNLYCILQEIMEGDAEKSLQDLAEVFRGVKHDPLFLFMLSCLLYWGGFRKELAGLNLAETAQLYRRSGYHFLAGELELLAELAHGSEKTSPFLNQVRRKEPWELLVSGLERLSPSTTTEVAPAQRIVWELNLERVNPLKVKVQKWGKKGDWTSGRKVALDELHKHYPHDMDEHDQKVFEKWVVSSYRGRREMGRLLLALVGHPRVFDKQGRNLRLSQGSLEVTLKSSEEHFQVQSSLITSHGIAHRKLGPTHFEVMALDERLHEFLALLSRHQGVAVPKEEFQSVAKSLRCHAQSQLRVSSDCKLEESEVTVAAPSGLVLRLTPEGQGLRSLALVAPAGDKGPLYLPGRGERFLMLGQGENLVTYERDLKQELKKWRELCKAIPHLSKTEQVLEEPLHCLELVESLAQAKDQDFCIEWPEGVKFRLKKRMGWKDFGLSVRRKKDWLEVDGQLQLSESEHWNLAQLLERHREQKSRFIQLGDGDFLALSEEFHRRLDSLKRAAKSQNAGSLELDALSGSVLLEDSQMVDSDEFWQTLQKRVEESRNFKPKLPSTLKATLRPYQEEGFRWLAASALRGVGCCLADDMGLGKTVQALALILSRAKSKGRPTLVVAPTSVCFNWMEETQRFAPDLKPRLFSQSDRETALQGLGGKDLMITSYGLLVKEIEKFQKIKWSTLILDESQAIKNPTTKRFKAAISLQADFRLATTGTPIENRVDEIWALFRFLNPGLLGTRQSFDKTYSGLEEVEEKRESLRRLLSPFILRRLKSQVLKDLPSRTDVNLTVEMTKEEKLHYESLRVHALERLANAEKSDAISILTELTRLRLACCHPRLVDPDTKLEGAKLKVLVRLLQDLKESGHRALVFSQFVGHLAVVKEELERCGLSYLYLDGSTPAKSRGTLVNNFQNGQDDFFLISLKAGGTGLNLTAANYVVHLDPWWNPAVEDQASDRAHRIGQKQPVTVYRLITKGTIEEKILELHKEKRELADTLLSGTDKAAKLSSEELLNLMKESVMTV